MCEPTDEDLMIRARKGDLNAFRVLAGEVDIEEAMRVTAFLPEYD